MRKALICMLCLICAGLFGQGIPYGQEFRVNTYTNGLQCFPSITALSGGGFVVCWDSWGQDGYGEGVYGQIFNETGVKINNEFRVNTYTDSWQMNSSVAALAGQGFVVCWESLGQDAGSGVYGQVFDGSGERKNDEFKVNTYSPDLQENPSVAALAGGGFVICWQSLNQDGSGYGVYGQVFDEYGKKKGGEIRVNTYTSGQQWLPVVAALGWGGFIVSWSSLGQDGSGDGVYGQVFDESGKRKNGEFQINTNTDFDQMASNVTPLSGGGFVVCWNSWGQDGSGYGVYGQIFNASGQKIGGEFRVNSNMLGYQWIPSLAAISEGSFVVCWESGDENGTGYGVYGQVFDESGGKKDFEFVLTADNSETEQLGPRVAALNEGGFVVCWTSYMKDVKGWSIHAKRFPSSPLLHVLKPFYLIRPADDVSLKTTDVHLEWNQPSSQLVFYPWELHYRVLIDENPDFSSPEIKEFDKDTTVSLVDLRPGTTYFWKVLAKNVAGDSLWSSNTSAFFVMHDATLGVDAHQLSRLKEFMLHQNYPNPFNPETSIKFDLAQPGFVLISVIDVSGRLIRKLVSESRTAGSYSVKWDGKDSEGNAVPSGIYICWMEVRSVNGRRFTQSVKMGLVR
jgi:hypothetical protein